MAAYPPAQPPFGNDWRTQRRVLRQQAKMQREAYRAQFRGLRRSSIVGPLLLIAIGVVVLLAQTGRLPWNVLVIPFAHWWPMLLVLVGVVRLGEWIFDQRSQQDLAPGTPYTRRSLGGGVIVLLILIVACGLLASGLHGRAARNIFGRDSLWNQDEVDEFLGDKHESDQTLTQVLAPGSELSVDNPHGDLVIHATSTDGQMHLDLHKEIFTRSDTDADREAKTLTPQIRAEGGHVMVSLPLVEGARSQLTITVPARTPLTVNANRGDIKVNSLRAPLALTANHGDVELSEITGPVSAHVNNGDSSIAARSIDGPLEINGHAKDVTLTEVSGPIALAGEFFGTTHLAHVSGPIGFHTSRTDLRLVRLNGELEISSSADLSADQVVGPMVLNTRNRNITLDRIAGDLSITNRNGAIDVTSALPLGSISVENRNGSVNVTLPTGSPFTVQADATNGELSDDFSFPVGGAENHPSVSGSIGQGGPLIRITTSQGDIALKRGSGVSLPPLPTFAADSCWGDPGSEKGDDSSSAGERRSPTRGAGCKASRGSSSRRGTARGQGIVTQLIHIQISRESCREVHMRRLRPDAQ